MFWGWGLEGLDVYELEVPAISDLTAQGFEGAL